MSQSGCTTTPHPCTPTHHTFRLSRKSGNWLTSVPPIRAISYPSLNYNTKFYEIRSWLTAARDQFFSERRVSPSPQFSYSWVQPPSRASIPVTYSFIDVGFKAPKVSLNTPRMIPPFTPLRTTRSESDLETILENVLGGQPHHSSRNSENPPSTISSYAEQFLTENQIIREDRDFYKILVPENVIHAKLMGPLSKFDVLRAMWIDTATVTVQRHWRGYLARKRAEKERHFRAWKLCVSFAARKIQRKVREYLERIKQEQRTVYILVSLQRQVAARLIQSTWLKYKTRHHKEQQQIVSAILRLRSAAAIEIQRVFRGFRARKLYECEKSCWVIKLLWDPPGRVVEVIGSFTSPAWQKRMLMTWSSVYLQYILVLPRIRGEHQLKFIVNGSYCCDGALTVIPDGVGHYNNVVYVDFPEASSETFLNSPNHPARQPKIYRSTQMSERFSCTERNDDSPIFEKKLPISNSKALIKNQPIQTSFSRKKEYLQPEENPESVCPDSSLFFPQTLVTSVPIQPGACPLGSAETSALNDSPHEPHRTGCDDVSTNILAVTGNRRTLSAQRTVKALPGNPCLHTTDLLRLSASDNRANAV